MIWIIGGTHETEKLLKALNSKKYIVTVATYIGVERLKNYKVIEKRMNKDEMIEFIKGYKIKKVIDMSHPYAIEVSKNAKSASLREGVEYIRFEREKSNLDYGETLIDREKLISYLKKLNGRTVFFTTGMKDIGMYEGVKGNNRFIYRVLPTDFSIAECVKYEVETENIVAMLGPFSKELNYELFKHYNSNFVVMKDSGVLGGTYEKISACKELKIEPLIIGRKNNGGLENIESIVEMIR